MNSLTGKELGLEVLVNWANVPAMKIGVVTGLLLLLDPTGFCIVKVSGPVQILKKVFRSQLILESALEKGWLIFLFSLSIMPDLQGPYRQYQMNHLLEKREGMVKY